MFDLGWRAPDYWGKADPVEPNSAVRVGDNFLSDDFCVIGGEDFFIRCIFEIPVHGMPEKFSYGVWSTLSRANFDRYVESFDDGRHCDLGPWWGWLGNSLPGFPETINQGCWVHPQSRRLRPLICLDDADHELAKTQTQGISPERLLELYAEYGHAPDLD